MKCHLYSDNESTERLEICFPEKKMVSHRYLIRNLCEAISQHTHNLGCIWNTNEDNLPFLAPWKKNLTTKTCKAAIATIIPTSTRLKLNILRSVLRTVLKFLFSRVLKYFCIRLIVLSWLLTLSMVSSRAVVCSGVVPAFWGSAAARDSFSI